MLSQDVWKFTCVLQDIGPLGLLPCSHSTSIADYSKQGTNIHTNRDSTSIHTISCLTDSHPTETENGTVTNHPTIIHTISYPNESENENAFETNHPIDIQANLNPNEHKTNIKTADTTNTTKGHDTASEWLIMYSNPRGLKGKMTSLSCILDDMQPHLFLLTETQLRSNVGISITNYTFYGHSRENKTGGGVGFFVRNDIRENIFVHTSERNLEIIWASIRRKNTPPLLIGTYYGKQERISSEDIEKEMTMLREEIEERKNDGEIFLAMDANAKIGILGEEKSRNGNKILELFENTNLSVMNTNEKCHGKITRKNTKNEKEISAIDFIVVSSQVEEWITKMVIDEEELLKLKGKNSSDHNTILVNISIPKLDKTKTNRITGWNIKASNEKWAMFRAEIQKQKDKAIEIFENTNKPFDTRYKQWYEILEKAARNTIGKTTFKTNGKPYQSEEVKQMTLEKRTKKKQIQAEQDKQKKDNLIMEYKNIQESIRNQSVKERAKSIKEKLEKIIADRSRISFWNLKRKITRDPSSESLVVKDADGKRQFEPNAYKETHADYYESLFKWKPVIHHPYHEEIKQKLMTYSENYDYDDLDYNATPTKNEIRDIIAQKKNNKSTPDIKNEMLKRLGDDMVDFVFPVFKAGWNDGCIAKIWNRGYITSMHKGKGDREVLSNHRGITTSSSIGTIADSLIYNRLEKLVPFTNAQGGGKKGMATCDHLFVLRTIIEVSRTQKRQTFLTFYDVSKAYDHLDNEDLLVTMWDKGLKGTAWRILKALNTNLSAQIKTKFGLTHEIEMEIGGKQGSRLTGRMFAKLMDLLAEELNEAKDGFEISEDFIVAVLLWVDDVISSVEGTEEQEKCWKN